MKNVINKTSSLFLLIIVLSCTRMSGDEETLIENLEMNFPEYKFAEHSDMSEAYLTVRLSKSLTDSIELKSIYNELIELKKETRPSGQPIINWIYLIVIDKNGEYLFTIVQNDDRVVFF